MQVVWFKRDLRSEDHQALATAAANGSVLPLYIVEPELWQQPDSSARHWGFVRECLLSLDQSLRSLGQPLWVIQGDAVEVLSQLHQRFGISALHSHMESGNRFTFERDLRVLALCKDKAIPWLEYRQHGVLRGLRQRENWAEQWERLMSKPLVHCPPLTGPGEGAFELDFECGTDLAHRQRGGAVQGWKLFDSFVSERGQYYRQTMGQPMQAGRSCSRLSPYLAFGAVSLREVTQRSRMITKTQYSAPSAWKSSMRSFDKRLHWHCHFIQKLESEPRMEFEALHRGMQGLYPAEADPVRLQAWVSGQTGWPLIDACMRAVEHTGWLTFRMRAMVVSCASYLLNLPWQATALPLARAFLDYEPGIHYSQMQMQSGTTGINANRMYNPVKQGFEKDPDGEFVKRWCPELSAVPKEWIHMPYKAPASLQQKWGIKLDEDYPLPLFEPEQALREARHRLKQYRAAHDLGDEAKRVLKMHGSQLRQNRPNYCTPMGKVDQLGFDF